MKPMPESKITDAAAARDDEPERRKKFCYIGPPQIFALEEACRTINDAFGHHFGCYLVGSALERQDFRDVDVRFIMDDAEFRVLFPDVEWQTDGAAMWEFDPRWLLLNIAISERLQKLTGLPIDFQIQPQTFANAKHKKQRQAIGLRFKSPIDAAPQPERTEGEK